MSSNASQHLAFQQPFLTFRALVTSMRAKQVPYSATDIYDGVQAFIPILHEHLRDEIGTLKADRLRKYVQEKDLIAMEKAMEAKIKENLSMILDPPLVFVNGDGKHGAWYVILTVCRTRRPSLNSYSPLLTMTRFPEVGMAKLLCTECTTDTS